VLASRLIDRLGKGLRTSPRDVMIAAACAPEQRGKAFGFHRAMDTVGACIGPLLAVLMLSVFKWDFRTIFLWAFIPALAGVVCFFFLQKAPANEQAQRELQAIKHDAGRAPLGKGLKRFIFIYAVFALGNSSDVFLILRAKDVGFTPTMALMTYVLYNFIYALAATPAGWLSDRVNRRHLMAGGFIVFALVYGGFALVGRESMMMIWILFGFYGIYAAATEGIAKAYITDLTPAERRGTAMGMMQTVTGLTAFAASLVAGLLWKRLGAPATFYYGAGCALAAAVLFFVIPQPAKRS
jgi:MFS family permease